MGLLALVLRLAFVWTLEPQLSFHDEQEYDGLARELAAHGRYHLASGAPTAFWPPGYPAFLALVYRLIGPTVTAPRVVQALLGAVTCLLVYRIGRRLGDARAAWLGTLAAAVYPLFIYTAGALYPVVWVTFLWAALILLAFRVIERCTPGPALLAGGLAGLIALATPSALPALLLTGAWIVWCAPLRGDPAAPRAARLGRRVQTGFCFLIPLLLLLGGWAARNAAVLGHPVIGSTNGGFNLWLGNHPDATATSGNRLTAEMQEEMGQIFADHRGDELARDHAFRERGRAYIREDFGHFVTRSAAKAANLWRLYPQPMTAERPGVDAERWLSLLSYGLLLPFAAVWLLRALRRDPRACLILLIFLAYTAVHAVFISKVRFRLPLDPYVILYGAGGIVALWDFLRRRRSPSVPR